MKTVGRRACFSSGGHRITLGGSSAELAGSLRASAAELYVPNLNQLLNELNSQNSVAVIICLSVLI